MRDTTLPKAAASVAAALLLASCSTPKVLRPPAPPGTDWSRAGTVTVKLADFKFEPERLELKVRTPIRLVLVNTGSGDHDFSAPAFFSAVMYRPGSVVPANGRIEVAEGGSKEIDILPIATGTYDLECTEFLHSMLGMTGKIDVTGDSGVTPLPVD